MSGPTPAWVRIRIRDADALGDFYRDVVGLDVVREDGEMRLTPPGGKEPTVFFEVDPGATPVSRGHTGLYHMAFRVPTREDLARMYRHLRFGGVEIRGAADHTVSEALYFHDPEGNGVEVYADRPVEGWVWKDGELEMTTDPLDGDDLLATTDGESALPEGSQFGHVHLRTSDLAEAEAFWRDEVGLQVTTRSWQGALFLATDRYHHHLGLNTWGGPLQRPPDGSAGLLEIGWHAPGFDRRTVLEDPDGHRVVMHPVLTPPYMPGMG